MKKFYFSAFLLAKITIGAQTINFPDLNLKNLLLSSNQWNFIAKDLNGINTVIDTNNDGEIQVNEALNISSLNFNQTQVRNLSGIQQFSNLNNVVVQGNMYISTVDVSNLANLKQLMIINNAISSINTTGCNQLEKFNLTQNGGSITNLNFLQNPSLKQIHLINNHYLAGANFSGYPNLEEIEILHTSTLTNTFFPNLDLTANINLKKISLELPNLSTLALSQYNALSEVTIKRTKLPSLNLSNNPQLKYLYVGQNSLLNSLNITNNSLLENLLVLHSPLLTNLAIINKPILRDVSIGNNGISSINFTGTSNIVNLSIGSNALSTIDFSPITNLKILNFSENGITNLDVSQNSLLESLGVQGTNLQIINCKNGNPNTSFNISTRNLSPNVTYICTDSNKIPQITNMLATKGHSNVNVNTYCSFTPGGTHYSITGNTKYDSNNNGCDSSDPSKKFQKFSITNGTNIGSYIGGNSGNFTIATQSGSTTITPVLENPNYFTFSPTSLTANFPAQTSPLNQNFCLTANGTHNDLETVILPLNAARPGFVAKYKLIYKNKGTTTQNGTVQFNYDDNLMNLLNSSLATSSQSTGVLNWNFTNLQPFETREVIISFTLSTPTQNPPLQGGAILNYSSQINAATDETPLDNNFALNQTVVNSFDPNDKTCLQGISISTTQVGEFVHYLIRFENTGTANAENIVVTDAIDASKFDLATLQPLNASHPFVTNIKNPNLVEFIFENIQLPFDDATNDGYISFKIKTKSTLNVGDSFSNGAKIYFDYNHPIITNTYTTLVQNTLSTQENYSKSNDFTIYPNPVSDVLMIQSKKEITKAEIYDMNGRIIISTSVNNNKITVSELTKGNYILKIFTKESSFQQKFIKN